VIGDCPVPRLDHEHVVLGHGSGGRLTSQLIERLFLPAFSSPLLARLEDQAVLPVLPGRGRLAFTTDSFVVSPRFFPGGDIGQLAVFGTVNDLAVGGATPLFLSAAFVLEEGLPLADLAKIAASMSAACRQAGVELVAADTKVVDRGKGDGLFITTSGIGLVPEGRALSISAARPGDRILVSGPIGDHGIAILSTREGLQLETELVSDLQPLHDLTRAMLEVCPAIRCMRDPTRGGLAGVLCDLAAASRVGVRLVESAIPLRPAVRATCELLGLDPLHVPCEGRLAAVVPAEQADALLAVMRAHPRAPDAAIVGTVVAEDPGIVVLESVIGSMRVVTPLPGEQLPRIC
jgi:hydrogenase expression/formation protein HypE